jgi:predicted DNA-binding protein (MmcQ/YjbR family)
MVDIEAIRQYCLRFPHTSEIVQWGADLCFKVDGKLFVVAAMEMVPQRISFKCTPENFAELCERPGIIPAPYMARAQWVSLERLNALPDAELREMISAVRKPKTASRKSAVKAKPPVKTKSSVKARSAGKTKSAKAARRK